MTAPKYRADHVGSLLRPPELLAAREKFSAGELPEEELRRIEDESVLKALEVQRAAGMDVFTDGEYRRSGWSAAAAGAIEGLTPVEGSPIRRIFAEWRGPDSGEFNLSRVQAMVAAQKVRSGMTVNAKPYVRPTPTVAPGS